MKSNADVSKMEVVTEHLLHEEGKQKDKESSSPIKACLCRTRRRDHSAHCGKLGHFRRDCRQLKAENEKSNLHKCSKSGNNQASVGQHYVTLSHCRLVARTHSRRRLVAGTSSALDR